MTDGPKALCLLFDQTTVPKTCAICQQRSKRGAAYRRNFLAAFHRSYGADFFCPMPDFDDPDPQPIITQRSVQAKNTVMMDPFAGASFQRDIALCVGYDGTETKKKKCCGGTVRDVEMVICTVLNKDVLPLYCQKCLVYKRRDDE